jgi:hypothetical protein
MTTLPLPDALPDIRAYLRTHPFLSSLSAGRVFFKLPDKDPAAPFIRLNSSADTMDPGDSPLLIARVGIQIFGLQDSDFPKLRQVKVAIQSIAYLFDQGVVLGSGGTKGKQLVVNTAFDSQDPATGWPRIIMDTSWTVSV